ncbi:SgcJ/EcaC family oxidoreductase [Acidipila sp. EB88]|uniref:YybH family protein n=1 Tax=Acidipila sp. EB88 TaxID=2305226 RepID=UPI0013151C0F|nr:SgcJ/EcaC family oxidoreductase [Acidipila sp. EB88]
MSDIQAITTLLEEYEQALNQSDTEAVMKLYAADGIFMPQHFPSSVGVDAVRQAYRAVFGTIQLTVKFKIEEVHAVSSEWAFARTNSAGTVLVNATGGSSAEANQELFVLQKVEGQWKIARYCFSTTNPPRA